MSTLSICTLSFWYKLAVSIFNWTYLIFSNVRACSHGSGAPRVPGVPSISIYSLLFIWLRSHAWWGTPLSRATRLLGAGCPPEWGRFFPCEQYTPGYWGEVHTGIPQFSPPKTSGKTKWRPLVINLVSFSANNTSKLYLTAQIWGKIVRILMV